jgi:hypothetical protein
MKTKLLTAFCALAFLFTATPRTLASDNSVEVIADAAVVRPGCFLATILGTAIFVAVLPIAATSKSIKKTARTLVGNPARATFTRPLGDFSSLQE